MFTNVNVAINISSKLSKPKKKMTIHYNYWYVYNRCFRNKIHP